MSTTVEEILKRKVSAIIRTRDQAQADNAMQAAVDGGFTIAEFTLTTPGSLELIEKYSQDQTLLVGAGTVMTSNQAEEAVKAGARFLVSPIADSKIIHKAHDVGAAVIPGAFTPLEMVRAHEAGADLVKIFPAPHDVPTWVQQVLGPLPYLRLFPTAGVTPDNLVATLKAGAAGAGFVASLFHPQDLAEGNFGAIRERAEGIHASLAAMRA